MDDLTYGEWLRKNVETHGTAGGIVANLYQTAKFDIGQGAFRPTWWLYASTFYLLAPGAAYAVRLFMVLASVFALPYVIVRRQKLSSAYFSFLALLLLSNFSIYCGLGLASLQETTGIVLSGLGLSVFFWAPGSTAALLLGSAFIFGAAAVKPPFIWLAFSVVGFLFLRGKKSLALAQLLLSVVLFLVIFRWSQYGHYTSRIYNLDGHIWMLTCKNFFRMFKYPAFLLLMDYLLVKAPEGAADQKRFSIHFALLCLGGGLLYLLNLVPWGSDSYHFAPPIYLISIGCFVALRARKHEIFAKAVFSRRTAERVSLALFVVVAGFVFMRQSRDTYYGNTSMIALRDWGLSIPQEGVRFCIDGLEPAYSFPKLMVLRSGGQWHNSTKMVTTLADIGECDYVATFISGTLFPAMKEKQMIEVTLKESPYIRIFKVSSL